MQVQWFNPSDMGFSAGLHAKGDKIGDDRVDEEIALVIQFGEHATVIEGSAAALRHLVYRLQMALHTGALPR